MEEAMRKVAHFMRSMEIPTNPLADAGGGEDADKVLRHAAFVLARQARDLFATYTSSRIGSLQCEPAQDSRLLRAHLLVEEVSEALEALADRDEVALADALGDLEYVNMGTAVGYDIPLPEVFEEIHRSNMTKRKTQDGRLSKERNFSPADIDSVMRRARGRASS